MCSPFLPHNTQRKSNPLCADHIRPLHPTLSAKLNVSESMNNFWLQQYIGRASEKINIMQFTTFYERRRVPRLPLLCLSKLILMKGGHGRPASCWLRFYVFGPSSPEENHKVLNIFGGHIPSWMDTPSFSVDLYFYLYEGCFCLCIYLYSHNSRHTEISTNLDKTLGLKANHVAFWT